MTVACGFLNDDGSRCDQPAVAYCQLSPAVVVPACDAHAEGTCLIVPDEAAT